MNLCWGHHDNEMAVFLASVALCLIITGVLSLLEGMSQLLSPLGSLHSPSIAGKDVHVHSLHTEQSGWTPVMVPWVETEGGGSF